MNQALKGTKSSTIPNNFLNSNDLCEFYKSKVARLETKFQELWELLDNFSLSYNENSKLQQEVHSANSQISQLQLSLSDLQVFLFREREENLRLAAENDALRIKDYENKKSIDVLLKLSGITRDQLNELLASHSKHKSERRNSGKTSGDTTKRSENNKPKHNDTIVSQDSLALEVKSLKTQLENLRVLFRTEVDVLLKDREVIAEERQMENKKLCAHIENLTRSLAQAQNNVKEATRRLLQEQKEREDENDKWRTEKEKIYKYVVSLSSGGNDAEYHTPGDFATSSLKCRCRICVDKQLQDRVCEQERLTNIYKRQCRQLDIEMKKWKEKGQMAEEILQEKTQHLTTDLAVMRNRCEALDRRRLLEAEGFRTDIRMLRDRIIKLDHKFEKIKYLESVGGINFISEDMKKANQKTLERAKQLEKEVYELKHKFTVFMEE